MQENTGPKAYLSTGEAAAYLGLKERTIYELVAQRRIPHARVTGKLLFPRALIDRWVESRTELDDPRLADPPPILAGSSDPLLNWSLRESGSGLATLFEGSEAGLARFMGGQAVAVGLHLGGRPESGEPPLAPAASRIADLVVLEWARREQGLVVARGNPLDLRSVADLAAKRPRVALRQPGSGAYRLFERLLGAAGLTLREIEAAPAAALTESDVAAMVAEGMADCGLAIGTVALRAGLSFVPLASERFELACRRRDFFEPPLQKLFDFARSNAFRAKARALGFYDVSGTGRVVFNA